MECFFRFLACLLIVVCPIAAEEQSQVYPGKLHIPKGQSLSAEEKRVEERFTNYLETHTDEAISRYQSRYKNEIGVDNVRELSSDYAPHGFEAEDPIARAARTRWTYAVDVPSRVFAGEIYRRELMKPSTEGVRNQVVFTAGGAGAGKTTSIRGLPTIKHMIDEAQVVYDTTLSNFTDSLKKVSAALESGKQVSIIFVYRDPVDALVNGALPRTVSNGRPVNLEVMLRSHLESPKVLLNLAEQYKNDPRVSIEVIDNSRGAGQAALADMAFLQKISQKYSYADLKSKLEQALEEARQKGLRGESGGISEEIYRAFKRSASKPYEEPVQIPDQISPKPAAAVPSSSCREYTSCVAQDMVRTINTKTKR